MGTWFTKFNTTTEYIATEPTLVRPHVSLTKDDMQVHYLSGTTVDYSKDYFTMMVTASGDIKWSGSTASNTLSYSKDNGDNWSSVTSADTISVTAGNKVLWKGTPIPQINKGIGKFSGDTNAIYSVEGNAMSLIYGDNFKGQTSLSGKNYAFYGLFSGRTEITSAENMVLLATTLADYCYNSMFKGCTNLTTAPELPATSLVNNCYQSMFSNCTSLTTAPELPATTLASSCYYAMFYDCTSLTTAPELPATTLASSCYRNMFRDCTNLTTAPELPATTLASSCYNYMFYGCSRLNYIKAMFTTTPSSSYMSTWVNGVASSGTFVKNSAATWTSSCGISTYPCNWVVTTASA